MSYLPLAWTGAAVFAAAVFAPLMGPGMAGILSLACGGLALCAFIVGTVCGRIKSEELRRNLRFTLFHGVLILLAAGTVLGLYCDRYREKVTPYLGLDQCVSEVSFETLDYPVRQYGKYYCPVRVLELDGRPVEPFQVRLSCSEPPDCQPLDRVGCRLRFYSFTSGGLFSAGSSRLAEGSVLGAYPIGYEPYTYERSSKIPPGRILPMLRRYSARLFDRCLSGDEASLLQAALLGRRAELSESIQTDFRLIGCSHMLAVSGLHMTMVGAFLNMLMGLTPLPRRLKPVISAMVLGLYLTITGFPVSAMRSYIMFAICALARVCWRFPHTLNSLGAAVVLICLGDPFAGGSLSFVLSVLATAGIAVLARPIEDKLCSGEQGRLLRWTAGTVSVSLAAAISTLPVQIAVFRGLPLLTLLSNLLLTPLFSAALYSALPLLGVMTICPYGPLVQPFTLLCGLLCRLLLKLSRMLAGVPGIYLSLEDPALLLSLILMLPALGLILTRRKKPALAALAMTAALLVPILNSQARRDTVTLAVSGDGETACVVMIKERRAAVLRMGTFNSGLARRIITQENVYTLESMLVSGGSYNSRSMARDLLENYRPKSIWYSGRAGKDLQSPGSMLCRLPEGGVYQALPGVFVQCDGDILRVMANGRRVLIAGEDCPEESCDLLITGSSLPQAETGLTLFMCPEDTRPEEAAMGLYSDFALVSDQEAVYAEISREGEVGLRSW